MMRFNHMELTFPHGTLTAKTRAEIDDFYGSVFGWGAMDTEIVGQLCHLLKVDDRAQQFILLAESNKPLSSPGYDHLGLLQESASEVAELLARCKAYQARDPRLLIKEYEPLVNPTSTVHAFYVKYLLPIWFDVQYINYTVGSAPEPAWHYV